MATSGKDFATHLTAPWDQNENPIWVASTLELSRNIEKFFFPGKLSQEKRKQIFSLVTKTLPEKEWQIIKAEETTPLQKEFLFEHFLFQRPFHEAHAGEGFALKEKDLTIMGINLQDHLVLQTVDIQGDLEKSWNRLVQEEEKFGKEVAYSYSQKFGFLTASSTDCGTGLRLRAFLQVPALIHTKGWSDFMHQHRDDGVIVEGLQGKPGEYVGDLIVVRNRYTIGCTEENILSAVRSFCTKVVVHEKGLQSKLAEEESSEMKDVVSRAYALLLHSYQLEVGEAMNALSLIKLGLELKWLQGMTPKEINCLFFQCRRAHLLSTFGEEVPPEQLPHRRATFIHEQLQGLKSLL